MVLNRADGPVGRAGHPGTSCAVLACILLHTCRTRVLPNASAPRSYALTTARHASLIWRKRCWWLFTSVLARVLEHGTRAAQWWSAGVVVGNERQVHARHDGRGSRTPLDATQREAMVGWRECMHVRDPRMAECELATQARRMDTRTHARDTWYARCSDTDSCSAHTVISVCPTDTLATTLPACALAVAPPDTGICWGAKFSICLILKA